MNKKDARWVLKVVSLTVALVMLWGCRHRDGTGLNKASMSWNEQFETNHTVIINGSWENAENSWAKLNKGSYTDEELKRWIGLQVEILEKTRNDPQKTELRLSAIQ